MHTTHFTTHSHSSHCTHTHTHTLHSDGYKSIAFSLSGFGYLKGPTSFPRHILLDFCCCSSCVSMHTYATHTHTHIYIHTHTYIYTHTHTHTHTHIYTHTHMHTHTSIGYTGLIPMHILCTCADSLHSTWL